VDGDDASSLVVIQLVNIDFRIRILHIVAGVAPEQQVSTLHGIAYVARHHNLLQLPLLVAVL